LPHFSNLFETVLVLSVMTFETVMRIWVGFWGLFGMYVGFFSKGEFRWGRGGNGPVMRPQWLGRLFFASIGAGMLLIAILGFHFK
jgi:hypothetical protein